MAPLPQTDIDDALAGLGLGAVDQDGRRRA